MLVNFRQGIISYQQLPKYIFIKNGNVGIDASIAPINITFAHGQGNYLYIEKNTVDNAWSGPFNSHQPYWLYWDINLISGRRSFGYTQLRPLNGNTFPSTPQINQYYFNITYNKSYFWNGQNWIECIRVFAGLLNNGTLIYQNTGSQTNLTVQNESGLIVFDSNGLPLKRNISGSSFVFVTTIDKVQNTNLKLNNIKIGDLDISGYSTIFIPKHYCVIHKGIDNFDNKILAKASFFNTNDAAYGITSENMNPGEVKQIILGGYIHDPTWYWNLPPLTPLFVGGDGEITNITPTTYSIQKIGYVVDLTTIFVNITEQILYSNNSPLVSITPTPTSTITPTLTPTSSLTPTITSTATPTITPTNTFTPSITITNTLTPTITPSNTITSTNTFTPSPTVTSTPTITITITRTNTVTPTVTSTNTPTIGASVTLTVSLTPSITQTITPTNTVTPSITPTSTITITSTNTPTLTSTPEITHTNTPSITSTNTSTPTPTITRTSSVTPTSTNTPTLTATPEITHTNTPTTSTGGNNDLLMVMSGSPFIAIGTNGTILTSDDEGVTWDRQVSNTTNDLYNIKKGNGIYVIVGLNQIILTSDDRITWTEQTNPVSDDFISLAFGNNTFVAGGGQGAIISSPDGITWTESSSGVVAEGINDIIYANGKFVASTGNGTITTSPDGITWTVRDNFTVGINDIIYANFTFLAVGTASANSNIGGNPIQPLIIRSDDGITWTRMNTIDSEEALLGISFCDGTFIAILETGTAVLVSYNNGSSWDEQPTGINFPLFDIVATNETVVAVGENGSIITSNADATVWTIQSSGTSFTLNSATFGNNIFVSVGNNETIVRNIPMTPTPTPSRTPTPTPAITPSSGAPNFIAGIGTTNIGDATGYSTGEQATNESFGYYSTTTYGGFDVNYIIFDTGVNGYRISLGTNGNPTQPNQSIFNTINIYDMSNTLLLTLPSNGTNVIFGPYNNYYSEWIMFGGISTPEYGVNQFTNGQQYIVVIS